MDKAEDILRRHSKGAPVHYRRLTEIGVTEGLIVPGGPTPEASLNSAITQDIKKREASGAPSRFRGHGGGYYSLARPSDPLRGAVDRKNQEVRVRLREALGEMHPRDFESLIGLLLDALGFDNVEVTRYVGDKGIDLRAQLVVDGITDVKTAIQVKRLTSSAVGAPTVRELRGGLGPHDRGLITTLSKFSRDAQREAAEPDRSPISLVNGEELVELLIDNQIGVTRINVPILELDEGFFTGDASDEKADSVQTVSRPVSRNRAQAVRDQNKVLSLWPLPGGGAAWKETLDTMLKFVTAEAPTMPDAISWLIHTFDRVESAKTARGYWQVLRSFRLIETLGEQLTATATGSQYLADPTEEHLFDIAKDHILGIEEMVDWLAEHPLTQDELLARFREELGVQWESTAQIQFRTGWLSILGVISQQDGGWQSDRSQSSSAT